jgi:hypothetical protein
MSAAFDGEIAPLAGVLAKLTLLAGHRCIRLGYGIGPGPILSSSNCWTCALASPWLMPPDIDSRQRAIEMSNRHAAVATSYPSSLQGCRDKIR